MFYKEAPHIRRRFEAETYIKRLTKLMLYVMVVCARKDRSKKRRLPDRRRRTAETRRGEGIPAVRRYADYTRETGIAISVNVYGSEEQA